MKKNYKLTAFSFVAFVIIWLAVAGVCDAVGSLFGISLLLRPSNWLQICLSAFTAAALTPTLAAYFNKLFTKK